MRSDPTLIGTVQDVNGASVTVELNSETVTGLSFVNGEGFRVGQVGSFVKIPLGFVNLYGVVSQVGAGAAPIKDGENYPYGNRWIKVQLVGEGERGGTFQRGLSQHPTIDDYVHIVTDDDLRAIYGPGEPDDFVSVGHLASAESIPALVDVNKIVTRHSAVVGTTGSGKSTTVAGLLTSLSNSEIYPSARIVVFDIHGEYANALRDRCDIYRINANEPKGEKKLHVPFWALNFEELVNFSFGGLSEKHASAVADLVLDLKKESLNNSPLEGVSLDSITVDSPIPFCIHKLWFKLHKREHATVVPRPGGAAGEVEPAYVKDAQGNPVELGRPMDVVPPQYRTIKTTGTAEERVQYSNNPPPLGMTQQLSSLASKLRDPRYAFLFNPGDLKPNIDGVPQKDLDEILSGWIGGEKPITILDLSGIPSLILNEIVGALLRVLYDAIFWGRNLPEGGRERPLLIVLEEAHAYLGKEDNGAASNAVRRIAKEGRKYGAGLMIVSQRPSEIDTTILSQCGTFFAMRLANDADRGHISGAASDNLKGLFDMLPVLRTGEAIIVGEAVSLPIRSLIYPPQKDRWPDSVDPKVAVRGSFSGDGYEAPGGWNQKRDMEDFSILVKQWRKQDPRYEHVTTDPNGNDTNDEEDL